MRLCALCDTPITRERLRAMPGTRLCVACKAGNDEPPLKADAPFLKGSLAESSVGDLEEMQAAARELGGIE